MAITVGLDIGSGAVRAAVVETARSGAVLRRFAEMPLPPGTVAGGDVIDEGAVTEAVAVCGSVITSPASASWSGSPISG
jgi:Tfp pilus assembly PilM family ATPase